MDMGDLAQLLTAIGEIPTAARIASILAECDTDASGTIDFAEFSASHTALLAHHDSTADAKESDSDIDQLVSTFRTLDKDGDGRLSTADLVGLMSAAGGCLTQSEAQQIITLADGNGDGEISLTEFTAMVQDAKQAGHSWRLRAGFRAVFVIGGPGELYICI
jgi:calmodulin